MEWSNTHLVCQELIKIIKSDFKNTNLRRNACITFGRFAGAFPVAVSPLLEQVLRDWCKIMSCYQIDVEKVKSFRGICAALTLNPAAGVAQVLPLLECATSFVYEEPFPPTVPPAGAPQQQQEGRQMKVTPEIEQVLKDMIAWLRNLTGAQWPTAVQSLGATSRVHLGFIAGER
eukprot:Protomagalhaensia_wolfi_Nauph_80__2679@NODE_280_length_2939_cov_43_973793_g210_i0_p3_GENE_NODE_280_length_2939_cov_43_973793_g210_i0NODE_280_length_2939_cov_43_973793_g210_i0_p3_ORF_typecomplete_len174_score27_38HEAT_EZ/PF13513_6/0_4HEAT_EZ/PF13513_6/3_5e03DUF1479/PF07350_12/0_11_NODE_280_length_2939_cov_43_973793_g210_i023992920